MLTITIFPLTLGSHFTKAKESVKVGSVINDAVTPLELVPGFQANCVACNDATLGDTISTWVMPLCQPFQVPHCWFSAEIPHFL